MVIHCYILNTFWYYNVFSQSAPSGPIEPPKFNQGLKSFNKDISRTVGQILKIRPHSRLQIQFSITFILCQCTIFLLLRDKNYKKLFLNDPWADTDPTFLGSPGPSMNHLGKFNSLEHTFYANKPYFYLLGSWIEKKTIFGRSLAQADPNPNRAS